MTLGGREGYEMSWLLSSCVHTKCTVLICYVNLLMRCNSTALLGLG